MSPQLATWLTDHLAAVALEGHLREWTPEQRVLVFPNRRGNVGRHSTFLEHVWQPLLLKAGLPYRKPHAMRHTEEKGIPPAPILAVRDWMGGWATRAWRRPRGIYTVTEPATAALSIGLMPM